MASEQSLHPDSLPKGDLASTERPLRLERTNLAPGNLGPGGTEIVLQRHGEYVRDRQDPRAGSLTDEAARAETESAANYFTALIDSLAPEELEGTYFLFVASDTDYASGGRRSYETTTIAQKVAETLLEERGVSSDNILNVSHRLKEQGAPRPMAGLREPRMLHESPDFVTFLKEKYGDLGKDFWIAFEEDVEAETRRSMGAEGPDEIVDRMRFVLKVLARYASAFHASGAEGGDSRLIIWVGTHYDTISPFVKIDVLHEDKKTPVLVDYGGGITLDIDKDGETTANVNGRQYPVALG